MRKLNELFRLKFEHGLSNRKVGLACNTHHSVVSDYLVRFNLAGLKWPLEPEIGEDNLYQKLFPEKQESEISPSKPTPDWRKVYDEGHNDVFWEYSLLDLNHFLLNIFMYIIYENSQIKMVFLKQQKWGKRDHVM